MVDNQFVTRPIYLDGGLFVEIDMNRYIAAKIARAIKHQYHHHRPWYDHKPEIMQTLDDLKPDRPADDTVGFLAYEVSGHDRMKMRTGRFLTRKLKLNNNFLSDTAIQTIAAQINTKLFGNMDEIRLDSGERITKNYRDNIGGDSCMSGSNACFTGLYADNPDKIKQLVMRSVNDTARAIVHVLDNGTYHMSRVYATSEDLKCRMVQYVHSKGWLCYGDIIDDKSILTVSDLDYTNGEIPYADSLHGYTVTPKGLTLTHTANDHEGVLDSTCGQLGNSYTCCNCDDSVDEDNMYMYSDDYYCGECYHEFFTHCDDCDEIYSNDDCTWIEGTGRCICDGCLENNYTRCDDCSEWFNDDKIYSVDDSDKSVCGDCLENYSCCDNCKEYFSDLERTDGDEYLCEGCKTTDYKAIIRTTPVKDCEGQTLLLTE